jgi:FkbM family methyltransferase
LRSTSAPARVLDVGGNIGFFSLVSAATGPFKIDTFEPNMANVLRFCESLWLNDWHSEYESPDEHHAAHEHHDDDQSHALVNLYNMGVGDTNGLLHFYENAKNPGRGKFEMPAHYEEGGAMPSPYDLNVITLDHFAEERGWFESKPDIAILKVDVEGLENKVIIGAAKLIQARLIHNILMEITVKNDDDKKDLRPVLELIVKAGYKLHKYGGFLGPGNLSKLPHDDQLIDTIMDKCQTGTHGQLNLWWKIMD